MLLTSFLLSVKRLKSALTEPMADGRQLPRYPLMSQDWCILLNLSVIESGAYYNKPEEYGRWQRQFFRHFDEQLGFTRLGFTSDGLRLGGQAADPDGSVHSSRQESGGSDGVVHGEPAVHTEVCI